MKAFVLVLSLIVSQFALAEPKSTDFVSAIPSGTKLLFGQDRFFPANSSSDKIGTLGKSNCWFAYASTGAERVVRFGREVTITQNNVSLSRRSTRELYTDKKLTILCNDDESVGQLVNALAEEKIQLVYPAPTDF